MKSIHFLAGLLLCAVVALPVWAKTATNEPDALAGSTQLIVVTTSDWNAVDGKLQRYERGTAHDTWHKVGEPISIVVGKHGMGWGIGIVAIDDIHHPSDPIKKEGDGKSPAGIFVLGTTFGDASQPLPGWTMPYLELTPSIECVDDPSSKYYNRVLDRSMVTPDWKSSEHMRNVGEAYRWGIVVDHNGGAAESSAKPPISGDGSCVFIHIWSGAGHGTAGCTAMSQNKLESLLNWLNPHRKPLLIQLPAPEFERLISLKLLSGSTLPR